AEVGEIIEIAADVEAGEVLGVRGDAHARRQALAHEAALHAARGLEVELDARLDVLGLLGAQSLEREREQRGEPLEDVELEGGEIRSARGRLDDDEADELADVDEGGAHERAAADPAQRREDVGLVQLAAALLEDEARLQRGEELEPARELTVAQ